MALTTNWTQDAAHIPRNMASPTDAIIPTYKYRSIVPDKEIRVLRLEPAGDVADPLVGSLFVRPIHDACDPLNPIAPYHCVSYCWGNFGTTHSIRCDDQSLWITSNVDEMLRYLRKPFADRNLWIDAICINQSDDIEKASQVGRMGLIYARADKVHIWLGPAAAEDQISLVFSILRDRASEIRRRTAADSPSPRPETFVAPVLSFLERPWFGRRWILQEVKLARVAAVHCGKHRLSWIEVRNGMLALKMDYEEMRDRHTSRIFISIAAVQALEAAESMFLDRLHAREADIDNLLWDYHSSKCSDERDRIFAFYGLLSRDHLYIQDNLLSRESLEACPIDYSRHFPEIYTQMATRKVTSEVKKGSRASILIHCFAFGVLADQDPAWPSWVPSWNMSRQFQRIWPDSFSSCLEENSFGIEPTDEPPSIHAEGEKYPIVSIQRRRGEVHGADRSVLQFFRASLSATFSSNAEIKGVEIMAKLLLRGIQALEWRYDSEVTVRSIFMQRSGNARKENSSSNEEDQIVALMEEIEGETLLRDSAGSYNDSLFSRGIDIAFKDFTLVRYSLDGSEAPGIAFGNIASGDYIFHLVGSKIKERNSVLALVIRPQKLHNSGRHSSLGTYRIVGFCLDCYEWADLFKAQSKHGTLHHSTESSVDPRGSVIIF
ncbi:heterokaryon incompatibility protein-domain-containing protein [Paraphoma chrysanthemicola]|uniref:Heterokaryon incompatibility protein-domain-containing protein n=1 Tax=Paraphoma chrysanthemicola TaxID=798071 RepID=A0A8K0W3I3_9PLEO|nr:heterokaryon incompatibility protein-domain-containing protein [Paraphoma chrysanthemicola]